eukprot:62661-Hanusia_phi.AAC.3
MLVHGITFNNLLSTLHSLSCTRTGTLSLSKIISQSHPPHPSPSPSQLPPPPFAISYSFSPSCCLPLILSSPHLGFPSSCLPLILSSPHLVFLSSCLPLILSSSHLVFLIFPHLALVAFARLSFLRLSGTTLPTHKLYPRGHRSVFFWRWTGHSEHAFNMEKG